MGAKERLETERIKEGVKQSFLKVKDDIAYQQWHMKQSAAKFAQLESQFSNINEQLSKFHGSLKEVTENSTIITSSLPELKGHVDALHSALADIKQGDLGMLQEINSVKIGIQNVVVGLYQKLANLEVSVKEMQKTHEQKLEAAMAQLNNHLEQLGAKPMFDKEALKTIVQEVLKDTKTGQQPKKESGLAAQLMKKIDKNRKSLIKQKIKDIVALRTISLPELKELIVDENEYCSKATFYRYIDEMMDKEILSVIEIDNIKTISLHGQSH